jgi:hypothetical protein
MAADAAARETLVKAKAEAEGNEVKSLTPELIMYTQWQNWDGQLPTTCMGGEAGLPIITLPTPQRGGDPESGVK